MSEKDIVAEARELLANAAHGPLELIRYEHGGGRLYRTEPRDLIADFYDAGNRELYYRTTELLRALADEVERLRGICDIAMKGVGAPIMHGLAQEALRQLRTARPKREASHAKH